MHILSKICIHAVLITVSKSKVTYQSIIMVHSLLSQMLKMSATISVLLIMMCNRSEYFLQFFMWIGSKYSFVSQVLQCSSDHPTVSTRRGAMSI